jgi:glycosyltransferase involved in cell wall biosynthesis
VKIAFDFRYACDHFTGIGTYAYGLLQALLERPGDERYVVLWDPRLPMTRFDLEPIATHPRVTWVERPFTPLGAMSLVHVGAWLRSIRPAVYYSPFQLLPLHAGCPAILTVHDVRPLRFTSELSWPRRTRYRWSFEWARGARFITTVSDFSRGEIAELLSFDPRRVRTIRPGVLRNAGARTPSRPAAMPDGAFALLVGDNRPHKNHAGLAEAWALLGAQPPIRLVAAGPEDSRFPTLRQRIAEKGGAPAQHLGRVRESELAWLYDHAALLLFPSLYEGFGSPLVEAFDHGVAAVASDIPALREVGGGAPRYEDPLDPAAWARAIVELAADSEQRARMIAAGRRVLETLTYDRTAEHTLALFREAAS